MINMRLPHFSKCTLFAPPPQKKFCIGIVFTFSWHGCNTQEKGQTKVMQIFFLWGGGGGGGGGKGWGGE